MIIHCPECKKDVSSLAIKCPHCGYPYPYQKSPEVKEIFQKKRKEFQRRKKKCPRCDYADNFPHIYTDHPEDHYALEGRLYFTVFYECQKCKHVYSEEVFLD